MLTAGSMPDPAASFASTDLVDTTRCVSAHIKLTYTGTADNASGQMCYIQNLTLEDLTSGGAGGVPLNVDELFRRYERRSGFASTDGSITARLPDRANELKEDIDHALDYDGGTLITTLLLPDTEVFGLAWRGLDAVATNALAIDFQKKVEWKLNFINGVVHVPEKHVHDEPVHRIIHAAFDKLHPNWDINVISRFGFQGDVSKAHRTAKHLADLAKKATAQAFGKESPQYKSARALHRGFGQSPESSFGNAIEWIARQGAQYAVRKGAQELAESAFAL
jgi:hypothetical protein